MKLLITGASGLLGINLAMEAMRGHEVVGVDRGKLKSAPFPVIKANFFDRNAFEPALQSARPDWVINCAALANLDECEKHPGQARILNTDLPRDLADVCARQGIKFVHLSTDAVYDGKKTDPYTEDDEPNPLGVYSHTKLEGEQAVRQANPHAIVARVNFFGWSLSGRKSLCEFFYNNLSAGKISNGFTDVVFCPMMVSHTARLLLEMLQKGLSGLYHVVGPQAMNKYQFGVEIARTFGLSEDLIVPRSVLSSGLTATRSHHLWLSTHKLSTDLGHELPTVSTGLAELYTQFQQGYPQKIRSYQQI